MEWVLRSPQMHSTFGNLGFLHGDEYQIHENCNSALETILHKILSEDKYLRTYRRSISFGQNINKDLMPLLLNAKDDKLIQLLVKILVNLTIPIECLFSVDVISKTDYGRHTIFEINNLLSTAKAAFTDQRATKVIIEFLKKNSDAEQKGLTEEQCSNINNSLLLLRNVLHIPEESTNASAGYTSTHTVQNQILWNIFSQSIDKILIKLMAIPEAPNWGVTMVQLIALLYKDQHVVTLHKLLNVWLELTFSESSEDNESNTSPPDRGSEDSSPMLTSDPTSESSDTGGTGKSNEEPNSVNNGWDASSMNNTSENGKQPFQPPPPQHPQQHMQQDQHMEQKQPPQHADKGDSMGTSIDEPMKSDNDKDQSSNDMQSSNNDIQSSNDDMQSCNNDMQSSNNDIQSSGNNMQLLDATMKDAKKTIISENSDCGYGTQIENQESISTSSNEDELPSKKVVHQKPHNPKQRVNTKVRIGVTSLQEKKRKKLVKRGRSNIINVQGLSHKTPTDDDIANIMKEFTVDFLLKGFNHIVQTLHTQILTNMQLEIDISHFFWLVTYFLKFATQIELDLEHVCAVLSYDVISYLTAEGVNLCEQFELAIKLDSHDLKPSIRRMHLVVTAIREFVQAIEGYKKFPHICSDDQDLLANLQLKMCETEELRSVLLLLLRHYNPRYHTKQYLQDLIVTNHILLISLDSTMKSPDYKGSSMTEHIKQYATPEVMYQYGLLLEDYNSNGEYVNDCIFTMMHHVGGELDCLICLFQPKILKTFTSIWKSEYEICDDWSDLIEYVINTFIKKPHTLQSPSKIFMDTKSFNEDKLFAKPLAAPSVMPIKTENRKDKAAKESISSEDRWSEDELSSLNWNFMQCSTSTDVVGEIVKLFKEDGILKTRNSVIKELFKQKLINKNEFGTASSYQAAKETRANEMSKLCKQLSQDGNCKFLRWIQQVLLDTCFAKICLEKKTIETPFNNPVKLLTFELFKEKAIDVPVMSPVSYHSLIHNKSVPLVPWNCEQAAICKDLKFLQLLHMLGFHMPVDTGKIFIRIPHFWNADYIYEIASKIAPIDTSKLKFSLSDIVWKSDLTTANHPNNYNLSPSPIPSKDVIMMPSSDTLYQIHKQKSTTIVNYTPLPGSAFDSDSEEANKQNWLQLIQRVQECKLPLILRSSIIEEVKDVTMEMAEPRVPLSQSTPLLVSAALPDSFDIPTVMTIKQEDTLPYSVHMPEVDCNTSLCDTASVASDLTRMYVSDEDDKTEVPLMQPMDNQDDLPMVDLMGEELELDLDQASDGTDSDNIAEKRARIH